MRVVAHSYKVPGPACGRSAAQKTIRQSCFATCYQAVHREKGRQMGFKFAVGQTVGYKPVNGVISLCTIVKQIPREDGELDFRYRIKNQQGSFVRNVFERDLTASDKPANLYDFVARLHRAKHH
jgi:hypothetical protein